MNRIHTYSSTLVVALLLSSPPAIAAGVDAGVSANTNVSASGSLTGGQGNTDISAGGAGDSSLATPDAEGSLTAPESATGEMSNDDNDAAGLQDSATPDSTLNNADTDTAGETDDAADNNSPDAPALPSTADSQPDADVSSRAESAQQMLDDARSGSMPDSDNNIDSETVTGDRLDGVTSSRSPTEDSRDDDNDDAGNEPLTDRLPTDNLNEDSSGDTTTEPLNNADRVNTDSLESVNGTGSLDSDDGTTSPTDSLDGSTNDDPTTIGTTLDDNVLNRGEGTSTDVDSLPSAPSGSESDTDAASDVINADNEVAADDSMNRPERPVIRPNDPNTNVPVDTDTSDLTDDVPSAPDSNQPEIIETESVSGNGLPETNTPSTNFGGMGDTNGDDSVNDGVNTAVNTGMSAASSTNNTPSADEPELTSDEIIERINANLSNDLAADLFESGSAAAMDSNEDALRGATNDNNATADDNDVIDSEPLPDSETEQQTEAGAEPAPLAAR